MGFRSRVPAIVHGKFQCDFLAEIQLECNYCIPIVSGGSQMVNVETRITVRTVDITLMCNSACYIVFFVCLV